MIAMTNVMQQSVTITTMKTQSIVTIAISKNSLANHKYAMSHVNHVLNLNSNAISNNAHNNKNAAMIIQWTHAISQTHANTNRNNANNNSNAISHANNNNATSNNAHNNNAHNNNANSNNANSNNANNSKNVRNQRR